MVTSFSRGHEIYFDGRSWRYKDNNQIDNSQRPCRRCGKPPTPEGYDACIGHIEDAESVCCGHGVEQGCIIGVIKAYPPWLKGWRHMIHNRAASFLYTADLKLYMKGGYPYGKKK